MTQTQWLHKIKVCSHSCHSVGQLSQMALIHAVWHCHLQHKFSVKRILWPKLKMELIPPRHSPLTSSHWNGLKPRLGIMVFLCTQEQEADCWGSTSQYLAERCYHFCCPPCRWRAKPSLNKNDITTKFLTITKIQIYQLLNQYFDND